MGTLLERGEKTKRVRSLVLNLLREHEADGGIPTNIRFVFYELEQAGQATKPTKQGRVKETRREIGWPPGGQDITDAVTWLRETGLIPWAWITDKSRSISTWVLADGVQDYLLNRLALGFRLNPWGDDELGPLVICEADATADVLERVAFEYGVPITGTRGQAKGFLRTQVSPVAEGRDVLYLGDLDLSGRHIEDHTRSVLEAAGWEGDWTHLAMTQEQADARGITPIVKFDNRYRPAREHEAIECEALGQRGLTDVLREALDDLLPEPLEDVLERERDEQEAAEQRVRRWRIR